MSREPTPPADQLDPVTPVAPEEQEETEDEVAESEWLPIGASIFTPSNPTTWRITLSTIMSRALSAGSSFAQELRADPIGLAQRSSAALINALSEGTIQEVTGKPDGPDIKYSSASDASLKCERSGDEDKFNFNPNGKFTGALIVQRKGKDGRLDPNNVDTLIFEDGRVVEVLLGNDSLGACRIGNIRDLQEQHLEEVRRQQHASVVRIQAALAKMREPVSGHTLSREEGRTVPSIRAPVSGYILSRAKETALAQQAQIEKEKNEASRKRFTADWTDTKTRAYDVIRRIRRGAPTPANGPSPATQDPLQIGTPAGQGAGSRAFAGDDDDRAKAIAQNDDDRAKAMRDVSDAIASVAKGLESKDGEPPLKLQDLQAMSAKNDEGVAITHYSIKHLNKELDGLRKKMAGASTPDEKQALQALIEKHNEEKAGWESLRKARTLQRNELESLKAAERERLAHRDAPAPEIQGHLTTPTPPLTPRVQAGSTDRGIR